MYGSEPDPKLSVDRKLRIGNWLVAWIGNWNGWIGNWLWSDRKLERLDRKLALAGSETGKAGSETWGWSSRKLGFLQLGALVGLPRARPPPSTLLRSTIHQALVQTSWRSAIRLAGDECGLGLRACRAKGLLQLLVVAFGI